MRYRDSKCNIGVHKIGVKLFGRLFDLSSIGAASLLLFEGCNTGGPSQTQIESREMGGSARTRGFSNRRQGAD